jgi:uncharacterized protein (DUF1499 family)
MESDRPSRIRPCPAGAACVSTVADDPRHQIEPIPYLGRTGPAQDRLREVIAALPRATVVSEEPSFRRASFRSAIFGFVDVADFEMVPRGPEGGAIHFRSRSRVGLYDFGVNRRRMEQIRREFESRVVSR